MDILQERRNRIIEFMKEAAYKPLKFDELAVVLDVPHEDRGKLAEILAALEQEGVIYRTNKDRYGIPEKMNLVVGRLQGSERGYGFLIPDDEESDDIFIPAAGLSGAMHNDRVIARITFKGSDNRRAEGEVIRILARAVTKLVGTFESSRYFGFVVPDDKKIPGDVFIPKDETNGAKPGQKVVAEIVKWPDGRRNAEGRIVEIIGDSQQPGIDILSIMKAYDLSESFPDDVMEQTEDIPDKVSAEMIRGRQDLRNLRMVTIDGEDAKDLDDAVSMEKLPDGCYRLGVHIADVSYYVGEGTPLDSEALKRGTSVYLVDRVIPMLPPKLSNGVCSLNPGVDRLAFSVMMDIDQSGRVLRHDIFESVIRTAERMTYTNVYKILETADEELIERYDYLVDDFRTMKELALILRSKRMSRGAIDFEFDEAKVIVDENGKPIDVKRYEITIANRIIEEFMLVCNETVAEHFHWAGMPFVFRIHDEPDSEKIMAFAEFAKNLGYPLKGVNHIHPGALQDVLEKVKGSREEMIVSTVMLRSMAKAKYSHQNTGHFGLAARFYCHFTSPIRRYPDLIIHRLMKEELKGGLSDAREEELVEILPEIARNCSERERAADEAERATEDLKKVEFMREKLGEVFEGVISNVTSFGFFVELENTIEGLVRVSSMYDDYYIFDDKHYQLAGERTGKRYRIGDTVQVLLARADVETRQIDFVIADMDERVTDRAKNRSAGNGAKRFSYKKAADEGKGRKSRQHDEQKKSNGSAQHDEQKQSNGSALLDEQKKSNGSTQFYEKEQSKGSKQPFEQRQTNGAKQFEGTKQPEPMKKLKQPKMLEQLKQPKQLKLPKQPKQLQPEDTVQLKQSGKPVKIRQLKRK
jgi:ribonuclease R